MCLYQILDARVFQNARHRGRIPFLPAGRGADAILHQSVRDHLRTVNWHIWTQSTECVMIGFAHRKTPPLWARSFFSLFEDVGQIQFISPVGAPDPFVVTDRLDELPAIGTVIVSVELGAVVVLFLVAPDVFLCKYLRSD